MALRLYLSLLCVLLLAFSLPCSASASDSGISECNLTETDITAGYLTCTVNIQSYNESTSVYTGFGPGATMTSNATSNSAGVGWYTDTDNVNYNSKFRAVIRFFDSRNVALCNVGNACDIGVSGVRNQLSVKSSTEVSDPDVHAPINYSACNVWVRASDPNGVWTDVTDLSTVTFTASATNSNYYDVLLEFRGTDFDVRLFDIIIDYSISAYTNYNLVQRTTSNYQYFTNGFYYSDLSYALTSASGSGDMAETNGFLETILQYVKEIWNNVISIPSKLADIFDNIKSGFKNLLVGILELPANLWELLKNGLIELFVPTDSQMSEYSAKWETLLSNRFGALYQSVDLIESVFESFTLSSTTDTLTFPTYSYDFGGGAIFSFGGQTVDIVPDGLEVYFEYLKIIINIVSVLALVNALKHRFVKVLEGGAE